MQKLMGIAVLTGTLLGAQEVAHDVLIERGMKAAVTAQPNVRYFARFGEGATKGAPYSADTVTETTQVLADGNRIVRSNKSSFARDGQGRTRHETQIQHLGPLGQTEEPLVNVFISDPVGKLQYHLDTRSKTVHRLPLATGMPASMPGGMTAGAASFAPAGGEFNIRVTAPGVMTFATTSTTTVETVVTGNARSARNTNSEDLGEKSFEGVSARGQRTTLTIPAGEVGNEKSLDVVTESWYSAALRAAIYTRHYDPRFGETVTRLTNVQIGEPSPHMFTVPADYKEASVETTMPARRVMVREEE